MPQLDVFTQDAFSMHQLTDAVNKIKYKPSRISSLALFQQRGVTTTSIDVELKSGRLSLIQTSPRGSAPPDPRGQNKRTMETFKTYRFARQAPIYADEVQNVRRFGSESELQTVQDMVQERQTELLDDFAATEEFHYAKAIQGLVSDADGTSLKNLFTVFGLSQQTKDFVFSSSSTDVRNVIVAAKRLSESVLGGVPISKYRGFCSPEWFDALVGHANVKEAYKYQQGQTLASDLRGGFTFGDVIWEEYRGQVTIPDSVGGGTATYMPADQAWLVPDAPIFVRRNAPADYEDAVNTVGRPLYSVMAPDPSGFNRYRTLEVQGNFICLCLQPDAVVKLTKS